MASSPQLQSFPSKPRVFILSDISNEPDGAESLVRYLLYSNQFRTEGLVACTSTWMKSKVCPQDMHKIVDGYEKFVSNLNVHVHLDDPYPTAQYMRPLIKKGAETYADAVALRSKLRIYTISDQDDSGVWLRTTYPDLFYISSVHGWNQYGMATWTGISGDKWYGFDKGGPDPSKISKEWIRENIQIGPLGSTYPNFMFIPEGDTPTFLGRYGKHGHYSDTADDVDGLDGRSHKSNQATIWRWRDAFQTDFAARMQWSLSSDVGKANHHHVAVLNGTKGPAPLMFELEAGSMFQLDASASYDPDPNDSLSFKWYQYKDLSASQWSVHHEVGELGIRPLDEAGSVVEVTLPPPEKCCVELISRKAIQKGQLLHLILEVKDNGSPALITYRRVVIQATNEKLLGGGGSADAIGDTMKDFMQ
ncbi:hypothetical protein N7449_008049 [Penicillium cf. viridicatum]|uniref:DUF1593-domain-containing protein n=1 Tax=Penicillium cf. viridicatum TaxID=2972119 RepID=A0A9W9JIG9_9EURO|nr:hypothetical protein N7449_008049 [Penicillium cf. viridicatum]